MSKAISNFLYRIRLKTTSSSLRRRRRSSRRMRASKRRRSSKLTVKRRKPNRRKRRTRRLASLYGRWISFAFSCISDGALGSHQSKGLHDTWDGSDEVLGRRPNIFTCFTVILIPRVQRNLKLLNFNLLFNLLDFVTRV